MLGVKKYPYTEKICTLETAALNANEHIYVINPGGSLKIPFVGGLLTSHSGGDAFLHHPGFLVNNKG